MLSFDGSHWLASGERDKMLAILVRCGIIKWNNDKSLLLASGKKTDIYINLRDMRSHPNVTKLLEESYANPLQRLNINRIVEIPTAVSPLAGHLSVITNIPLVTIREEAKPGRVTTGCLIGDIHAGERVAIIDDVISDGGSKIHALNELRRIDVNIAGIVVLVDRQEGWGQTLAEAGFGNVNVWAGMTLDDVRKHLVTNSHI